MQEKEMSPIIERLCKFIEYSELTNSQFADKAGIPRPSLSQMLHGRNKSLNNQVMAKLNEAFPELNIVWLLFGSGNMLLNSNIKSSERQNPSKTAVESSEPAYKQNITDDESDFSEGLFATQSESVKPEMPKSEPVISTVLNSSSGIAAAKQVISNCDNSKKIASIIVLFSDGSFETFVPPSSAD